VEGYGKGYDKRRRHEAGYENCWSSHDITS
jgi:hypothetical protein